MIEGLKPYAEYKESGLPWLNIVPKHWDMAPNRALMRDQRQVVGSRASDYTLLSLTLRGVIARDMVNPKGKFPAQFNTYKVVKPDDFVFCLFDIDETPRGVGLSPLKGMITGAYDVFSPTPRINPRFLYHYYLFVDEGKLMKPLYTGLRKTIQRGVFASLKAPLPPPDEQAAIVRFLDHANRKIDGFIRAKRKLIGLLNEQKQAIIHRAVTGKDEVRMVKDENGNSSFILQPSTLPKKPSGIPWLGDIPKHWEVWPLKSIGWFKSGAGFPVTEQGKQNLEMPFLKVSDMTRPGNEVWIESCNNTVSRDDADRLGAFVFPAGSIIFPKVGGAMLTNKRRLLKRPSCIDNNVMGCVVRRGHLEFVFLLLQQLDFGRLSKPGPVPAIGEGEVREIKVVFPPLDEQKAIVPAVEKEAAALTTAIARTEREIALMQEYRTRLTADLVTGKLDVREAAAQLPAPPVETAVETETDEPLEETETEEIEA